MPTTVKVKYILSGVSLIFLLLASLYEKNFFRPDQMIRFRALTWDDFDGIKKPFTGWGAAISSNVFIEFDSVENRFRAYSAMNKATSWKKSEDLSDYLLNHEQYHFNLSQYYALKLDAQLEGIDDPKEAVRKLRSIQVDLSKAQTKYDSESDHDLNYDMQHYWEFKIDSVTTALIDSTHLTRKDLYTGLEFYNLDGFEKSKRFTDNGGFETEYEVNKYGLTVSINSVQNNQEEDPSSYREALIDFYSKDSMLVKQLDHIDFGKAHAYQAHIYDTTKNIIAFDYWLVDNWSIHILRAQKQTEQANIEGYQKIFNALSKSMNIMDFRSEWISLSAGNEQEISNVEKYDRNTHDRCMVIDEEVNQGFIPDFITDGRGNLLIPYTPVIHNDSLIETAILFFNDNIIESDISDSLVFLVPKEYLSEKSEVFIGYTLKADTVNICSTFYNSNFILERSLN